MIKVKIYDDEILVPERLAERRQWVAWTADKVPVYLPGSGAKANDPSTWLGLHEAESIANRIGGGIGFELGSRREYDDWSGSYDLIIGVDFDHCLDEKLNPNKKMLETLNSLPRTYTEISPSGHGIHALFVLRDGNKFPFKRSGGKGIINEHAIEVYVREHYFTFSGRLVGSRPNTLATIDREQVLAILEQIGANRQPKHEASREVRHEAEHVTDDDQLLAMAILTELSPARPYEEWRNIGMALETIFQDGGETWDAWSSTDPEGYRKANCLQKARGFNREHSIGTIIKLAKEDGIDIAALKQQIKAEKLQTIKKMIREGKA